MSEPEFEELTGKPIPADELSEAKKFADFDGKEQMMCGWQTVHRELHVIHTALLAVEKERNVWKLRAELAEEELRRRG